MLRRLIVIIIIILQTVCVLKHIPFTLLYSFETIHNIKIFEVEFSPSMSRTMKEWNLTVQWWISTYVHRKLPFKNKNMRWA